MNFKAILIAALVFALFSQGAYSQKKSTKPGKGDAVEATSAATSSATGTAITSQRDTLAYALGMNVGSNLLMNITNDSLNLNVDLIVDGIRDGLKKNQGRLTQEQIIASLTTFQKEMQAKQAEMQAKQEAIAKAQQEVAAAKAPENKKKGEAFLAENAKKEGVKTLPSGLQYKVITEGTGKSPKATDKVSVNYSGSLIDGTNFDNSAQHGGPATFPVNRVIKGWTEALQLMKEGSKWMLYIPSELAYGERGQGQTIGPNEVLVFEVELLKVEPETPAEGK